MASLGEAVIEVGADTSGFRRDVKRGAKEAQFEVLGKDSGKKFSAGFNKGSGVSSFSQLNFSFARLAAQSTLALSTITPIAPALVGVVAGVVALGGAVGLAAGSILTAGTAVSSLGLAAITTKVALGGMGEAIKAQAKAQEELAKTGEISEATQAELNLTMKKLSPAARAAAKAIGEQGSAWLKLRQVVQEGFFKGVAKDIGVVSKSVLPVLKQNLGDTAGLLNKSVRGFGAFVSSSKGVAIIDSLLGGLNKSLESLLPSVGAISRGLLNLFAGSTGQAATLSNTILNLSTRFEEWTSRITESGKFAAFLASASNAAGALLGAISAVGKVLITVFGAGAASGVGMLQVFTDATNRFNEFLKSADGQTALATFFATIGQTASTARDLFSVLAPVIAGVGDVIRALLPGIDALRATLLPIAQELGAKIGAALTEMAPKITEIVNLFKGLLPVLGPIVAFIAGVFVSAVIGAVNGVLNVVKGLLTIITGVVNVFKGIFTGDWALVWEGLKQIMSGAFTAIIGAIQVFLNVGVIGIFRKGVFALKGVWTGLWNWIKGAPGAAFAAIKAVITSYLGAIRLAFSYAFKSYGSVIKAGWAVIRSVFSHAVGVVRGVVSGAFNAIKGIITGAMSGARSAVTSGVGKVIGAIKALPGKAKSALGDLGDLLKSSGEAIIRGLIRGITDMSGAVSGAVKSVLKKARDLLPFSPAKTGPFSGKGWTLYSGRAISEALAKGITQSGSKAEQALSNVLSRTARTADIRLSGGANSAPAPMNPLGLRPVAAPDPSGDTVIDLSAVDLSDATIAKLAAAILAGAKVVSTRAVAANNRAQEQDVFV